MEDVCDVESFMHAARALQLADCCGVAEMVWDNFGVYHFDPGDVDCDRWRE